MVRFSWASVVGVAHLFSPSATVQRFGQVTSAKAASQASADGTRVQSVVGVVQTAKDAVHAGIGDLLIILISINLFVGIFNLFPMLPLDGGHVAIAVYEKIRTARSHGARTTPTCPSSCRTPGRWWRSWACCSPRRSSPTSSTRRPTRSADG